MPYCLQPGCPNKVPSGRCPAHARQVEQQRERAKPYRQWYRREPWLSLRKQVLADEPFCRECGALAEAVDHVIPHKGDRELFLKRDNLRALCTRCNSTKANTTDRQAGAGHGGNNDSGGSGPVIA